VTDDQMDIFDGGEAGAGRRSRRPIGSGSDGSDAGPRHGDGHEVGDGDGDEAPEDVVDLAALRAALSKTASKPQTATRPVRSAAADGRRAAREAARRRTRRRRRSVTIALLVLALISTGVIVGFLLWRHSSEDDVVVRDFSGTGDREVVVQVHSGDGLPAIARTLAGAMVVGSAQAFVDTASADADVAALKPGYYRLRQHSSAATAADQIVDASNRVGRLRLIPGRQLADVTANSAAGPATVPGLLSEMIRASCVPLNGITRCATIGQLQQVARTTPPAELGVVEWAIPAVTHAPEPDKRLEGLILPGDYDVPPGADAKSLLASVMSASTARWNSSDIISAAAGQHLTPYQATIVASVVEREGITADMPQVARVVYNRLARKMKWEMDSTVNYALNRAQISTSEADRANPSPYNTYAHAGMPPTPIGSPGAAALDATVDPAPGNWLFFVKVNKAGKSCFSATEAQHRVCVQKARAAGVFDG
jgi:UPF0755 protein